MFLVYICRKAIEKSDTNEEITPLCRNIYYYMVYKVIIC